MPDLPLANQIRHGARDVFDRHVGVHAVLVVEVDRVHAQSLQRAFGDLLDVVGPAVQDLLPVGTHLEPEFRGDDDLAAERLQRLADDLLVDGAVNLRRIEECDASFGGCAYERDRLLRVGRGAVAVTETHRAVADGRDVQAAVAESALLHRVLRLARSRVPERPE